MTGGLAINNHTIEPGTYEVFDLHVGKLPSGTKISIKTHVYASEVQGPTLLILAGLHGDEINGIEIVRRTLTSGIFEKLSRGNVIVIPVLNVYGFINFSREVPGGKDVNRSFPGSMRGSLASRVARILTKSVLPNIDFGIDIHTGGDNRFNYPQIRFTRKDTNSEALAKQFGAPFIIEKAVIKKSLRKAARDMGIPMIIFEGGEALRLDGYVIETALQGIERLLHHQGMLDTEVIRPEYIHIKKTSWIRASKAGIFIWSKKSGTKIEKGETLGSIYDPSGTSRVAVTASRDGYIIGHNNTPVVHQGDALFHLGYEVDMIS